MAKESQTEYIHRKQRDKKEVFFGVGDIVKGKGGKEVTSFWEKLHVLMFDYKAVSYIPSWICDASGKTKMEH